MTEAKRAADLERLRELKLREPARLLCQAARQYSIVEAMTYDPAERARVQHVLESAAVHFAESKATVEKESANDLD